MKRIVLIISIFLVIGIIPGILKLTPNIKAKEELTCDAVFYHIDPSVDFSLVTKEIEVISGKVYDIQDISNNQKRIYTLSKGVYFVTLNDKGFKEPVVYKVEVTSEDLGTQKDCSIIIGAKQGNLVIDTTNFPSYYNMLISVKNKYTGGTYSKQFTNGQSIGFPGVYYGDYEYSINGLNNDISITGIIKREEFLYNGVAYTIIEIPLNKCYLTIDLKYEPLVNGLRSYMLYYEYNQEDITEPSVVEKLETGNKLYYEINPDKLGRYTFFYWTTTDIRESIEITITESDIGQFITREIVLS